MLPHVRNKLSSVVLFSSIFLKLMIPLSSPFMVLSQKESNKQFEINIVIQKPIISHASRKIWHSG